MKGNTIIKTAIVIAAISVVCYVIYHSNRSAEITELVKNSPEEFDLNHYVDSIADEIRNTVSASSAYKAYNNLYEEINVYASITKADGSAFVNLSNMQTAYEHAFNAYWPFINLRADEMFQSSEWSARNEIRTEVNSLLNREGIQRVHKDSLSHYKAYISGYGRFKSLLDSLEKCKNATTYSKLLQLENYKKYPYCNLSKFQTRRNNADDNARNAWKSYLTSRKTDILMRGNILLKDSSVYRDDVISFGDLKNQWKQEVISYEETIQDDSSFVSDKQRLESIYIELAEKVNKQKNY